VVKNNSKMGGVGQPGSPGRYSTRIPSAELIEIKTQTHFPVHKIQRLA
jgi:hypothetical protein